MRALFPEGTGRGTGAGYAGTLHTAPPELDIAVEVWRCRHTHYDQGEATSCALAELRQRWAAEYLGLPDGWHAMARPNPESAWPRWGVLVTAPGDMLACWMSQYRWGSPATALSAAADNPDLRAAVGRYQGRQAATL